MAFDIVEAEPVHKVGEEEEELLLSQCLAQALSFAQRKGHKMVPFNNVSAIITEEAFWLEHTWILPVLGIEVDQVQVGKHLGSLNTVVVSIGCLAYALGNMKCWDLPWERSIH